MATSSRPGKRARGEIETLPSGSLRVRVYAGIDPVSKKKHYLVETIPAGPKAAKEAERVRTRLLNQVDERRAPRTRATVNQLMDRYLNVVDIEETTRITYEGYVRNHVLPLFPTGGPPGRRGLGLVLRTAPCVPRALPRTQVHRAPNGPGPPVRRAVWTAQVPPAG